MDENEIRFRLSLVDAVLGMLRNMLTEADYIDRSEQVARAIDNYEEQRRTLLAMLKPEPQTVGLKTLHMSAKRGG